MNMGELLKRNEGCPVCHHKYLINELFSRRNQNIYYEEDNLKVVLDLRSIDKMGVNYKVGFFFSLKGDSFRVEFYTKHNVAKFDTSVPLYLINNFNEFAKNVRTIRFTRKCPCNRFFVMTENILLDYKNSKIGDIKLLSESFGFITQTDSDYKVVVLNNYHDDQTSKIFYWRQNNEIINYNYSYPEDCSSLSLPLIPFISEEKTRERLNNLLLFI